MGAIAKERSESRAPTRRTRSRTSDDATRGGSDEDSATSAGLSRAFLIDLEGASIDWRAGAPGEVISEIAVLLRRDSDAS